MYVYFLLIHTEIMTLIDQFTAKLETPAKRKLKFSYDSTPTPCPPQKKQRVEDSISISQESAQDLESDLPALEYVDPPASTQ